MFMFTFYFSSLSSILPFMVFLFSLLFCLPPFPPHPKEQIYMSHSRSRDTNASVEFVFDFEGILLAL